LSNTASTGNPTSNAASMLQAPSTPRRGQRIRDSQDTAESKKLF
jgi:hypothetical protein